MEVFFVKLQSDQKSVLQELFTDLLAKILDEFEFFLSNFEFLLQDIFNRNPYLTLLLSDYNARNTNWWHHDITTTKGIQLETTTTIYGLRQLVDESTHIRKNSSSGIDLIFANQPNVIVNRGTHPSLHKNC